MQNISYTEPLDAAWRRMRTALFRPLDFGKWFALGFTAWLATLGENGSLFANINVGDEELATGAFQFARDHLVLIGLIGGIGLLIVVALSLVFLWLRGRGKFMFLDNLLHNRVLVSDPWRRYRPHGNSYFRWSLAFGIVVILVFLFLIGLGVAMAWPAIQAHRIGRSAVPSLVVSLPLLALATVVTCYVALFMESFIVPLMYRHSLPATEAWRKFRKLLRNNIGAFLIYGLFFCLLWIGASMLVLLAGCLTCCCGFVILSIPYLGAVFLLPVTVFFRLYSVEFLKQFGPEWDVETPPAPPPLP